MYITDEQDLEILREIILEKKLFRNQGKDVESQCARFEHNFAQTIGTKHSLLLTSGTNALICALNALELKAEDEVIIPSFTFFATAGAVINAGATPIIVNIDRSLMVDPEEVVRAITKKTKAIIAVHMDGHPSDLTALKKIAASHNLYLIEDVAQATGGSYLGKRLGAWGDVGCFSFNVEKIISCGEGGALTTDNRLFYEKSLCTQDMSCAFGPTFKDNFSVIKPFVGQSMRVSEISGALMNVQLKRLDNILDRLRIRKNIIKSVLDKSGIAVTPSHDESGDCGTSIYLPFNSPETAKSNLHKLAEQSIVAIPNIARTAHNCWQWMHLLSEVRPPEIYKKSSFLSSIDILMSTVKINTPFELDENQTEDFAKKIVQAVCR